MDSNTSNNSGTNFNDSLVPQEEGAPLTPDSTPAPNLTTDTSENGSLGASLDPANFGASSIDVPSDPSPLGSTTTPDAIKKEKAPKADKEPMPKGKLIAIIVTAANLLLCTAAVVACVLISNSGKTPADDPIAGEEEKKEDKLTCEPLKCIESIALSDTSTVVAQKLGVQANPITVDFKLDKNFMIRLDRGYGSTSIKLTGKYSNLTRSTATTSKLEEFTKTLANDYVEQLEKYKIDKQTYDNASYEERQKNNLTYPTKPYESTYDLAKTKKEIGEGILVKISENRKTYVWVSKDKKDNYYLELDFSTTSGLCTNVGDSDYSKAKVEEFKPEDYSDKF